MHRWHQVAFILLASNFIASPLTAPILAQKVPAEPEKGIAAPIGLAVDRKTVQIFLAVEEMLKEHAYTNAVNALQTILNAPQDSFVATKVMVNGKEVAKYVSAKTEANRLIGALPAKGLAEYHKLHAADADERLRQAVLLNDHTLLAEVAERYLHTPSGPPALARLGRHCLTRDEPHLASLYYDRLLLVQPAEKLSAVTVYYMALAFYRAHQQEQSEAAWKLLTSKIKADGGLLQFIDVTLLRKKLDEAAKQDPKDLLDWPNFRGGATRTEQGPGGAALLESIWTTTTLPTKPDCKTWTEDNLNQGIRALEQRQLPVLPAFFPIAVGPKVIYRAYDGVYALNLEKEGKLSWSSITDGGISDLFRDLSKKMQLDQWTATYRTHGPLGMLFQNSSVGTLSSDGERIFLADEICLPPHPQMTRNFQWGGVPNFGALGNAVNGNSLKGYNLDHGKLMWELGGRFEGQEGPWRDSFFLGPPLALGGKLYVLNEKDSELRLVCILCKDTAEVARQPEIVWKQSLAHVRDKLQHDFSRRINAAQIAYADGILVCPTNAGAVIGVDLLTHAIVWAHTYRDVEQPAGGPGRPRVPGPGVPFPQAAVDAPVEWRPSAPAIAAGKIVFAAPDAPALHCLHLKDGSLVWKQDRKPEDLYFAGVFAGKVVIVGKSYCRALNLADGKEVWRLNDLGTPSGQGSVAENVFYLPLLVGADREQEIHAIDIAAGKVIARTKSRKKEEVGNIFFHDGLMISQTVKSIAAYPLIKAKLNMIDERIKGNPNDPVGRIERGRLLFDKGDFTGAYEDFRTGLANKPSAELQLQGRQMLFDALSELLQRDFAKNEKRLEEFKGLISADNRAEQRQREVTYLRVIALGR